MKAITLHQPWATLIALGAKQYETRSWYTSYRGPLVIHAGKNTQTLKELAAYYHQERTTSMKLEWLLRSMPASSGVALAHYFRAVIRSSVMNQALRERFTLGSLPRGAVVALVDLVDVLFTDYLLGQVELSQQERAFGNFGEGRYAWKLANVRMIEPPIPARGYQQLWECSAELETAIRSRVG